MAILTWLGVPGTAEAWSALAFDVSDGRFGVGGVTFEIGHDPAAWGFDAIVGDGSGVGVGTVEHPPHGRVVAGANAIDRIDHVVYAVPELDPAVDAMTVLLGEPPRRRAHPRGPAGPEMAFFRAGDGFIEVVASGRPPALWGIAFSSDDLDACVDAIRAAGGPVGDPKPAVQGGRIASVWKGHVGWGVAIMEPPRTRGGTT